MMPSDVDVVGQYTDVFQTATRNTMDVNAVPVLQSLSHLPVFNDPSHAAGKRQLVEKLGIAAGADGLIVEIHPEPDRAVSDGAQSLNGGGARYPLPVHHAACSR